MSENGEIYTAGKNFTLPPAVTAWTKSTSVCTSKSLLKKVMVAEEVAREREVAAGQKQRKEIQLQVNKKSSSLDYEKL